jgi:hypothetical protein
MIALAVGSALVAGCNPNRDADDSVTDADTTPAPTDVPSTTPDTTTPAPDTGDMTTPPSSTDPYNQPTTPTTPTTPDEEPPPPSN